MSTVAQNRVTGMRMEEIAKVENEAIKVVKEIENDLNDKKDNLNEINELFLQVVVAITEIIKRKVILKNENKIKQALDRVFGVIMEKMVYIVVDNLLDQETTLRNWENFNVEIIVHFGFQVVVRVVLTHLPTNIGKVDAKVNSVNYCLNLAHDHFVDRVSTKVVLNHILVVKEIDSENFREDDLNSKIEDILRIVVVLAVVVLVSKEQVAVNNKSMIFRLGKIDYVVFDVIVVHPPWMVIVEDAMPD